MMQPATKIEFRQVRDVSDLINATFQFLRQNFKPLGKSLLFIAGPAVALAAAALAVFQVRYFGLIATIGEGDTESIDTDPLGFFAGIFGPLGAALLFSMISTVLALTVVLGFIRLYQERGPGGIEVDDVWQVTKRRFWPMLGTSLVIALIMMVPVLIVVIPCLGALAFLGWIVYAMVTFSLAYPMRMQEDIGVGEALRRCRELVRDQFWPTLGALFLVYIIYYMLANAFAIPSLVVAMLFVFNTVQGEGGFVYEVLMVLTTILQTVVSTLLYAVPVVAIALQYYNLVERKERTGLMARIQAVGGAAPAEGEAAG